MFSQEQIFEKVNDELKRLMHYVELTPEHSEIFLNQAFGVVQFVCQITPKYEKELIELWVQWKYECELFLKITERG